MFISKALRRAEVFLEQVDESVANASRRLVVEGATGAVAEDYDTNLPDDEDPAFSRASSIPTAETRTRPTTAAQSLSSAQPASFQTAPLPPVVPRPPSSQSEEHAGDGWGDDVDIDGAWFPASESEPVSLSEPQPQSVAPVPVAIQNAQATTEPSPTNPTQDLEPPSFARTESPNVPNAPPLPPTQNKAASLPRPHILSPAHIPQVTSQAASQAVSQAASQAASQATSQATTTLTANVVPRPGLPAIVPTKAPSAPQEADYVIALKAENKELRNELEHVENDFETSRRDRTKLVKNLKRMKDIVSEMDESLRDKSTEARELQEELLQARDELHRVSTDRQKMESRGKDELDAMRKDLSAEITTLKSRAGASMQDADALRRENERLKEALLHGHEVDQLTADGARQEASQAHNAYETETQAHRETRQQARQREEALEEEAALATIALATAQRKAEECTMAASASKSQYRSADSKLGTVTEARDAAFARIEDLEGALRLFEGADGEEAPGQRKVQEMEQTVSELENALEAKNVELNRLEGELEAVRASHKNRRDGMSPRTPGANRSDVDQKEVEIKLRHMADSALRKQGQLEVMRSENRALQHQLTSERKRTREAQAMAAAASSSTQSIRGGFRGILDVGQDGDRTYGMRDGPLARFRTPQEWPRMISKAISGMDRISAQALMFLRREPLLRIVVLIYIVAMHVFVYSVLHWHVSEATGSVENTHGRVASAKVSVAGGSS